VVEEVSEDVELLRLRKEAAGLRDLVRELSAALARAVSGMPLEGALAAARSGDADPDPPLNLESWRETIEMTRADVATEMDLLWKRLPPRESA
jgi:hypothetical protein